MKKKFNSNKDKKNEKKTIFIKQLLLKSKKNKK